MQELGPVDRTLVAIARALESIDTRRDVLVLDEPTARLPREEAARLLERLQALKQRGLPILYITHRLEELPGFADEMTILRDGYEVYAGAFDALPFARLRELIAGLEPGTGDKPTAPTAPQPRTTAAALELRGVASERLRDIDFTVHEGEIVAVTGLVGSGRSELGRVIYGLQRFTDGRDPRRRQGHGRPACPRRAPRWTSATSRRSASRACSPGCRCATTSSPPPTRA